MSTRNAAARGLWVAAVVFAGACADNLPTEGIDPGPSGSLFARVPDDRSAYRETLDHAFERIARDVPGFGGLFYDESGTLNVVIAQAAEPMSVGELRNRLAPHLQAIGRDPAGAQSLVVREGRYDFAELLDLRQRIDHVVWGLRGVVYTDADEVANRVTVGVEDAAALTSVEHTLAMLGVPSSALNVRTVARPQFAPPVGAPAPVSGHSLRDRVRPVAGGLGLRTSAPFFGFCAVGFNVRSPEAPGVRGFVTDAFCSAEPYGTGPLGTQYWQPAEAVPESLIGTEAHNAPPFTDGVCPTSPDPIWRGCRWTTAAGGRYAAGVDHAFGRIYRTTGPGSLVIDEDRPMFEIVGELGFSVVGQQIHKIGAETGWTQGAVISTCVNVGHSWFTPGGDGAVTVLCQDQAAAESVGFFDRAAPVFVRVGEHEVELLGIVSFPFGPTVFYSPMDQIRLENPAPPGRTWLTH